MCDHSSRANLSPEQVEGATLLSCQLAFLAEASKNGNFDRNVEENRGETKTTTEQLLLTS